MEEDIERLKLCSTNQCHICGRYEKEECMLERNRCEQHILSDYKRVLKENEELNIRLQEEINEKCKLKTELYLNSIPKSVIEDKIDVLEKIQKEFKNNEELRIKIITYKELLNKGE